jgi:8-oxo-dGTP pyrophosphatase MutT (NUDIX family)
MDGVAVAVDDEVEATGSTVTFELRCGDKFLLIRRPDDDRHFGGYWAFPGGRVRAGESLISAAERECEEETGISPSGKLYFVDSYPLEGTTRTGIHFTFEVSDDIVRTTEFPEHKWVSSVKEMSELTPRIAGIDNHAVYSSRRLSRSRLLSQALDRLEQLQRQAGHPEPLDVPALRDALTELTWSSSAEAHLTRPDYLNP